MIKLNSIRFIFYKMSPCILWYSNAGVFIVYGTNADGHLNSTLVQNSETGGVVRPSNFS